MQMMFYFWMTVISAYQTQAYRFAIFIDTELCTNETCAGGVIHTACEAFKPNARCSKFEMLKISGKEISTMILGHNGIRNKIANEWSIANMNILHWSKDLELLSKYYLYKCQVKRDLCDFLVKKEITIGRNFYFSKKPLGGGWSAPALRDWYRELGFVIKSWKQYKEAQEQGRLSHFSSLIWPKTEFVGCAAARMFNGYMTTCYYHPDVTKGWNDFELGRGCSKCPQDRSTCSREFSNLCGLDIPYDSAGDLLVCKRTLAICILISFLFSIYLNTVMFSLCKKGTNR